jgi:uncharacterized membrane protein YqhA
MSGRVAGLSRFIVVAPVIGLFVAAVALTALASIDVVRIILEVLQRESSLKLTLVAFIEVADVYLLSIVLYIISLGLYELFIDENVALPRWLQIHTLEDLKEKLVSVVVVVLAVFFLGKVIEATDSLNVLYLGTGIAVMIAALGYFVGRVLLHQGE